jgi:hypothetical protein
MNSRHIRGLLRKAASILDLSDESWGKMLRDETLAQQTKVQHRCAVGAAARKAAITDFDKAGGDTKKERR